MGKRGVFLGVLAITIASCAMDKDRNPAQRARRKELCPDLDTWRQCEERLAKKAADDATRAEAERVALAKSALEAARASIEEGWRDYDRSTEKTKAAFFEIYGRAVAAAEAVPKAAPRSLRDEVDAAARERMAPLINGEARASYEANRGLIPSPSASKCRLWGAMWVADDETLESMLSLGFNRVVCDDRVWDLQAENRRCFVYGTALDDNDDARGAYQGLSQGIYGSYVILVWKTLDAFARAQLVGPSTGENDALAFLALASDGAQNVMPGSEFEVVDSSPAWLRIDGRGPQAGVSGYVELGTCRRKKR